MPDNSGTFSKEELLALKMFYAGVPARKIRKQICNPWPIVARHRGLPREEFDRIAGELATIE